MNTLLRQSEERLLRTLAVQLAAWHEQGRWHGGVTSAAVSETESGEATLHEPAATVELSGELCPPELRGLAPLTLSTNLAAAAATLHALGQSVDPRRIDVYQLAVLIVTTTTGSTLDDYLCRPLVSAKVPAALRRTFDRALGFSASQRITNCAELLQELAAGIQPPLVSRETPSQGLSLHAGDTDAARKLRRRPDRIEGDLPFQRLGQYEIVARLGSGGMGDVYQGYDADLDRNVAIKVLPAELARHEDFVARFRVEAAAAAKVEHPHIVPIYTIGSDQGHHFFAMQLVAGETLGQLLERQSQPPLDVTLSILDQVVSGLAAAHRQGLVHRDIKPSNILLTDQGRRALVADFGLAKSIAAETRMTATGVIMGTVDYLSPEQGRGKAVDGRSDLYSIGVLLYQMLAGRLPFEADSPTAMIFQHAYEPPPPLATIVPQVPKELAALVHRLLAKSPDDRYATAEDLLDDLQAIRAGHAPSRLKSASVRQRTAIIVAPKFDDEPALTESFSDTTPASTWSFDELYQRTMLWLGRKAPEVVRRWQNTQQQVDGAVFEYQQRSQSLNRLVGEAEDVQRLLAEQLASYEQASTDAQRRSETATDDNARAEADADRLASQSAAAELRPQIAQQRDELESMQLARAQANAKLASIQIQRDALNARLQVAHARYGIAHPRIKRKTRRWLVYVALASVVAGLIVLAPPVRSYLFLGGTHGVGTPETSQEPAANAQFGKMVALKAEVDSTGREIRLPAQVSAITFLRGEANNEQLLAATEDGGIIQFSLHGGFFHENAFRFVGHESPITCLAWNPATMRLASGASNGGIAIWDRSTGQVWRRMSQEGSVGALEFSPEGRQLLSRSGQCDYCWNVDTGEEFERFEQTLGDPKGRSAVVWLPDKGFSQGEPLQGIQLEPRYLTTLHGGRSTVGLTGNEPGRLQHEVGINPGSPSIHVWNSADGSVQQAFAPASTAVAYSRDRLHVLTGDSSGKLTLWKLKTGEPIMDLGSLSAMTRSVCISSDGTLAAATDGSRLRVFSLPPDASRRQKAQFESNTPIKSLAFSPTHLAVVAASDQQVRLWWLEDRLRKEVIEGAAPAAFASFSSDGSQLLLARTQSGREGLGPILLREWPVRLDSHNSQTRRLPGHRDGTTAALFVKSGKQVLSGGNDNHLRLWDVKTEQELKAVDVGMPVRQLAATADGRLAAVIGDTAGCEVWNLEASTHEGTLSGHTLAPQGVAIASGQKRIVTVSRDRTVRIWSQTTCELLNTIQSESALRTVAVTADGRIAVAGADDGLVLAYDLSKGIELGIIGAHDGPVVAVSLSIDGGTVVSAGIDRAVYWWELPRS